MPQIAIRGWALSNRVLSCTTLERSHEVDLTQHLYCQRRNSPVPDSLRRHSGRSEGFNFAQSEPKISQVVLFVVSRSRRRPSFSRVFGFQSLGAKKEAMAHLFNPNSNLPTSTQRLKKNSPSQSGRGGRDAGRGNAGACCLALMTILSSS